MLVLIGHVIAKEGVTVVRVEVIARHGADVTLHHTPHSPGLCQVLHVQYVDMHQTCQYMSVVGRDILPPLQLNPLLYSGATLK